MTYHFEEYRIQVQGEGGPKAETITGVIVGPFGVAEKSTVVHYDDGTAGQYHKVTHLHSGLCVVELGAESMRDAIAACEELRAAVPWWKSRRIDRIESENRLEQGELKSIVMDVARKNNCIEFE